MDGKRKHQKNKKPPRKKTNGLYFWYIPNEDIEFSEENFNKILDDAYAMKQENDALKDMILDCSIGELLENEIKQN
jgi:hypothetical protein